VLEFVSAPRTRELVGQALQPLVADMQVVREGVWARPLAEEIRAVVEVVALKGAQYDISYGVCCTWVPVSGRSRSRFSGFPRTLKQTTLHLWVDHFTKDAPPRQWISTSDAEKTVRRQAHKTVQQVMDRAPAWWRSVATPEGVLAEARRQDRAGFDTHFPRARQVAAFTLARLGDVTSAQADLRDPDEASELSEFLTKVPRPSN
jgi:hypothetical protein